MKKKSNWYDCVTVNARIAIKDINGRCCADFDEITYVDSLELGTKMIDVSTAEERSKGEYKLIPAPQIQDTWKFTVFDTDRTNAMESVLNNGETYDIHVELKDGDFFFDFSAIYGCRSMSYRLDEHLGLIRFDLIFVPVTNT